MLVDLIVATADKSNPDPVLDLGCYKRGHIIHWEPIGHQWTQHELTSPNWRIVTVDLPESHLLALIANERGDGINKHFRRRRHALDLDALGKHHFDGPRQGHKVTALTRAHIVAATKLIA